MNITEKIEKLKKDFNEETHDRTLTELRGMLDTSARIRKKLADKRGHQDMRGIVIDEAWVNTTLENSETHLDHASDLGTSYWMEGNLQRCESWAKNQMDIIAGFKKHWLDKNMKCIA